jgi:hypothetical protein
MALFTGFVDSSETRTNRQANREFRVMTVRTLAFTVPVVFDPELAPEPGVGASVMVDAWLSGRMPSIARFGDEAPRARGRLSRLLGR